MERKKILFIINPKAGSGSTQHFRSLIDNTIDKNIFEITVAETAHPGHATALAQNGVTENFECVAAVGGDGTVNEVAKALQHTKTCMAIIPYGSGNGLARHLRIPRESKKALALINNFKSMTIDTFEVNGQLAVNVAGVGFDAFVAERFAKGATRGFLNYVKCVLQSYSSFHSFDAKILVEKNYLEAKAWMISFANSTQFGNNASIAPFAICNDGVLDITVCKKIPFASVPLFALALFTNRLRPSSHVQFHKVTRTILTFNKIVPLHIDGEPKGECDKVEIRIQPLSLNVIVP